MNRRQMIWVGAAFVIFIFGMFVAGPALQGVMDAHQPYLIVDPDATAETKCQYDYLTYIPVEMTGKDPSEGVRFVVSEIPIEYAEYVHYPDSWSSPFNPFNPANNFAQILSNSLKIILCVVCVAFIAYLGILWRRGKLRKMRDKINDDI